MFLSPSLGLHRWACVDDKPVTVSYTSFFFFPFFPVSFLLFLFFSFLFFLSFVSFHSSSSQVKFVLLFFYFFWKEMFMLENVHSRESQMNIKTASESNRASNKRATIRQFNRQLHQLFLSYPNR